MRGYKEIMERILKYIRSEAGSEGVRAGESLNADFLKSAGGEGSLKEHFRDLGYESDRGKTPQSAENQA